MKVVAYRILRRIADFFGKWLFIYSCYSVTCEALSGHIQVTCIHLFIIKNNLCTTLYIVTQKKLKYEFLKRYKLIVRELNCGCIQ